MIKWWRRISFKLFFAIFGLLLVIMGAIFASMYRLLPDYQYRQELDRNYEILENFITGLEGLSTEDVQTELSIFYGSTNVKFIIVNEDGLLLFPFVRRNSKPDASVLNELGIGTLQARADNYTHVRMIELNGEKYSITYSIPVVAKDRIRQMLLVFLFYSFIVSSILAAVGAWILARRITGPVIEINETANKMEQLDFSASLPQQRKDELGQLSKNLNSMSKSVETNLVKLNSANEQLQVDAQILKYEEAKRSELSAVISHELKTPIAAVMGQLEAMSLNIGPYADRDKYLKESYVIMEEMQKLAEDVLEIAKVNYVDLQDNLQTLNLSELVEQIVQRQRQFFSSSIQTFLDIQKDLIIDTQQILFSKALENIISNAYQYCLENGHVTVSLKENAAGIEIMVFNTAKPISDESLERVFEAFYRVDKSRNRKSGGTGLGLYIVANNFEKLGVQFEMTNERTGIQFVIKLPPRKIKRPSSS
ncbi:HAMP domain-containing protein [Vagococcus sp. BWB3-3]|uniref:histidine kinase n=1 Tax=Vagococcus allomyrinae TaxID=2794353 RepID=A0A940SVS6_9ENTE|nr:ATP-binding protein [Vagococcus allomyrinae]MBP1042615.1 HAMP domain-containing protein [Vagococcus allomyrinae]